MQDIVYHLVAKGNGSAVPYPALSAHTTRIRGNLLDRTPAMTTNLMSARLVRLVKKERGPKKTESLEDLLFGYDTQYFQSGERLQQFQVVTVGDFM